MSWGSGGRPVCPTRAASSASGGPGHPAPSALRHQMYLVLTPCSFLHLLCSERKGHLTTSKRYC